MGNRQMSPLIKFTSAAEALRLKAAYRRPEGLLHPFRGGIQRGSE
jgi:hypothetical protein